MAVGTLAAAGLGVCLVGAIAELDWVMLAVMLCLSALAGFAFYFKSLPLALALASELHRSPARLVAARYWRMWPQYVALGMGGLLAVYAYGRIGLAGAMAVAAFWLLVRHLAGRYVDLTLDSVRNLRNANEALEHQAFHDPLTNMPNRALFAERLEHAMVRAGDGSVAVLFLDLDNFKMVNDTLGHAGGDALLIAATERLVQCVRREDTIARLGGDEFTVLLEEMRDPSDAARMAERIGDALRLPFDILGQQVPVSCSIGIALDTDRSHSPDDLLREADLAMYRAKSGGKARYEIFDTGMAERAMERLGLETELRHAVERDEMSLTFEPVISVEGELEGMAAQLRWHHPRHGQLNPADFVRIAEETGVILDLGRWTLEQACREAWAWQRSHPGRPVHVGVSLRQLDQRDFVDTVRAALKDTNLSAHLLRLELPESSVTDDDPHFSSVLAELDDLGVKLAVTNVGASALSLARLAQLPLDMLKLHADASEEVTRAASALGRAFGMRVAVQTKSPAPIARAA